MFIDSKLKRWTDFIDQKTISENPMSSHKSNCVFVLRWFAKFISHSSIIDSVPFPNWKFNLLLTWKWLKIPSRVLFVTNRINSVLFKLDSFACWPNHQRKTESQHLHILDMFVNFGQSSNLCSARVQNHTNYFDRKSKLSLSLNVTYQSNGNEMLDKPFQTDVKPVCNIKSAIKLKSFSTECWLIIQ